MRDTRLILFEGLPGSGKSTAGQRLAISLERLGVPVRWWHEEDPQHPLYPFHGQASLQTFLRDLETGRRERAIRSALDRWRALGATQRTT